MFRTATLVIVAAGMSISYRDFESRPVPKEGARRLAVAVMVDEAHPDAVPNRDLLGALLLSRLRATDDIQLVPRLFDESTSDLIPTLQSLEVDDLLRLNIQPRERTRRTPRREKEVAKPQGTIELLDVCSGEILASVAIEDVPMPSRPALHSDRDARLLSLVAICDGAAGLLRSSSNLMVQSQGCRAIDAATAAERDERYHDAAIILTGVLARLDQPDPALLDRRDLALIRSGRAGAANEPMGAPAPEPEPLPSEPFAVEQGALPVIKGLNQVPFTFVVDVRLERGADRGGVMIASKAHNYFVGLSPGPGKPRLYVDTRNNFTRRVDRHEQELPTERMPLQVWHQLRITADGEVLDIWYDGEPTLRVANARITQPWVFLFAELSTVWFREPRLEAPR